MRRIVYILLLVISTVNVKSQVEKRDSLLKLLSSAKEDTGKVMLLLKIADMYETSNQDSSIYYLTESKRLSGSLKFKRGFSTTIHKVPLCLLQKGITILPCSKVMMLWLKPGN